MTKSVTATATAPTAAGSDLPVQYRPTCFSVLAYGLSIFSLQRDSTETVESSVMDGTVGSQIRECAIGARGRNHSLTYRHGSVALILAEDLSPTSLHVIVARGLLDQMIVDAVSA